MRSNELIYDIDYGNLTSYQQHILNTKAYEKYYDENFENDPLTFNSWYATKYHKKYLMPILIPILRKEKLKQIEKANQ